MIAAADNVRMGDAVEDRAGASTSVLWRRQGPPIWLLTILLLVAVQAVFTAYAQSPYQVKAAVLGNLAKFVEWPASSFSGTSDPVRLGIFGDDPFGPDLETILQPIKAKGRSFKVVRSSSAAELLGCHIVFFSTKEEEHFAEARKILSKKPILLAGEDPKYLEHGGMLNFYVDERKVRFTVNPAAAEKAGLSLHPQLLRLAAISRKAEGAK